MLAVVALAGLSYTTHGRQLSEPMILSYAPASNVAEHARIDLDQAAMENAMETGCDGTLGVASQCAYMAVAKDIYTKGGYSSRKGVCTLSTPLATSVSKKAAIQIQLTAGGATFGTKTAASATGTDAGGSGATTLSFYYPAVDTRLITTPACVVGGINGPSVSGLDSGNGYPGTAGNVGYDTTGCLVVNSGTIEILDAANSNAQFSPPETYTCTVVDNAKASRTLQGFSTKAKKLMYDPSLGSAPAPDTSKGYPNGVPYTSFIPYWNYYCADASNSCNDDGGYANDLVIAAMDKTQTNFKYGNWDLTNAAGTQLNQVIKKGTAYMNAWMYAIREFEDAIDDCSQNALTNNDMSSGSVHAWDEGVAFYVGSILEVGHLSGSGSAAAAAGTTYQISDLNSGVGKLAYDLANKRCANFKTCGPEGDRATGQALVNYKLFDLFTTGQIYLRSSNRCGDAVPIKNEIVQWMTIPLIQGTLRYAYKGENGGTLKSRAEGAIFAAAVVPQVHDCNPTHAATIHSNLIATLTDANPSISFVAVKQAFEACYPHMFPNLATPCAYVGSYYEDATANAIQSNGEACVDPSTAAADNDSLSTGAVVGIAVAVSIAVILALGLMYVIKKERSGTPIFTPLAGPGKAGTTTASSSSASSR